MDNWILVTYASVLVLIIGIIFILLNNWLASKRQRKWMKFIAVDAVAKTKRMVRDLLNESMDIIPEKIVAAQKIMDEAEGQ